MNSGTESSSNEKWVKFLHVNVESATFGTLHWCECLVTYNDVFGENICDNT